MAAFSTFCSRLQRAGKLPKRKMFLKAALKSKKVCRHNRKFLKTVEMKAKLLYNDCTRIYLLVKVKYFMVVLFLYVYGRRKK